MNPKLKNQLKIFAFILTIVLLELVQPSQAQNSPTLRFNKEGKFKIVQFTDVHMKEDHVGKRDSVIEIITTIIKTEKPDLVVLSGDIATSENVKKAWLTVVQPIINAKIPWAAVFGNHDWEHGYSNKQIMEYLVTLPYNCSQFGPKKINGTGNYVLKIKDAKEKQTEALIYCFDSNNYTEDKENPELGEYGWIRFDQIEWYRKKSAKYTQKNEGKPLPALAFFHIPLPEYKIVQQMETTIGDKEENIASPVINSGMYNAMLEMKDVMGTFVGHDHNNNFIGCLNQICLAYGCKTGLDSYGHNEKGARVIEIYEGKRKFDSWIHTLKNNKEYLVSYPESFKKKK
jgi:hypothetical protein